MSDDAPRNLSPAGARARACGLALLEASSRYETHTLPAEQTGMALMLCLVGRGPRVDLPDALAEAIEEAIGPREDRNPAARIFAPSGADALRTSIGKACQAPGVPGFSPHDLRHRRISLLHFRGVPWARIGELVGQRDLAVTANTYSHVLLDECEIDYAELLA